MGIEKKKSCYICKTDSNLSVSVSVTKNKFVYCDECCIFGPQGESDVDAIKKWNIYISEKIKGKPNEIN